MIVGIPRHVHSLLHAAMSRGQQGLQPRTVYQYKRQFKLFLAFVISHQICQLDCRSTMLVFLEFLTYKCFVIYCGNELHFCVEIYVCQVCVVSGPWSREC